MADDPPAWRVMTEGNLFGRLRAARPRCIHGGVEWLRRPHLGSRQLSPAVDDYPSRRI